MLVTVYTHACYTANNFSDEGISIEIDLANFSDVPTPAEIHSLMAAAGMTIPPYVSTFDAEGITIAAATDPMWKWFEGEDPTNWTIEQAWEFDNAVSTVHSSFIEEFGLFVTNYWNVRRHGVSGLVDAFHDSYSGTYASGEDYAQELYLDTHDGTADLNSWPFTCIDWEAAWDELVVSGDNTGYETQNGQIAIFSNHF